MPLINPYGIGSNSAVRGKATQVGNLAGTGPGVGGIGRALLIEQLPFIHVRAVQTTPTGVGLQATMTLQAMIRIGVVESPKFENITSFVMLAGGVVTIPFAPNGFFYPAAQVRLVMMPNPGIGAGVSTIVNYELLASA